MDLDFFLGQFYFSAPNIPGRIPERSPCYTQILHSEHTTIVEAPSQIGIDSTATTSLDNLKGLYV